MAKWKKRSSGIRWIKGKNISFGRRYAEDRLERLP
jgi:hypothetical protein